MRLASFRTNGAEAIQAGNVDPAAGVVTSFDAGVTVESLLRDGSRPEPSGPTYRLSEVELLAPHRPRGVFCMVANYGKHREETGNWIAPAEPLLFMKGPGSVVGPSGPVVRPRAVRQLDYEAELALVIGPGGEIAGYAVADDISARDFVEDRTFLAMKSGDTFCPFGPWITTVDEIPDALDLRIRTWVDGEVRQDARTDEMIFGPAEILAQLRRTIALEPGDLVLTGTPAGVAFAMDPAPWLQPGQTVRIEIEGLGSIEHPIVDA